MNGATSVSRDSCMYAEQFGFKLVDEHTSGELRQHITSGLEYYYGTSNITDALVGIQVRRVP
jgi:hypothetical protein